MKRPGWVRLLALATLLSVFMPVQAADRIHKCRVQGRVVYQSDVCPLVGPRQQPSISELNAARRNRPQADDAPADEAPPARPAPAGKVSTSPAPAATMTPVERSSARCDGRRYCSQMRSCEEARYFLAHCPTVKMDGDGDGVPCEMQWCH